MFYEATYLVDGYILADAFRLQPGWGSKVTRVQADTLPPHTDSDIVDAAHRGSPPGYWLQRVDAYGGTPHQRTLFVKSTPFGRKQSATEGESA